MLLDRGSQLFQSTLEAFDRREVSIGLPIQVRSSPRSVSSSLTSSPRALACARSCDDPRSSSSYAHGRERACVSVRSQ